MKTASGATDPSPDRNDLGNRAMEILTGFRVRKEEKAARRTLLHIRLAAGPNGYQPAPSDQGTGSRG